MFLIVLTLTTIFIEGFQSNHNNGCEDGMWGEVEGGRGRVSRMTSRIHKSKCKRLRRTLILTGKDVYFVSHYQK